MTQPRRFATESALVAACLDKNHADYNEGWRQLLYDFGHSVARGVQHALRHGRRNEDRREMLTGGGRIRLNGL